MVRNKCEHNYVNYFGEYQECDYEAWEHSKNNYCILHAINNNKPKELFNNKLREKIENGKNKDLDFTDMYFCDLSAFKNREINKRVIFERCYFTNKCIFEGTVFNEIVDFSNAESPKGSITFKKVVFKRDCDFSSINFLQIYLSNVKFIGRANFKNSKIKMLDITDCGKTIFMSLADFSNTKFRFKVNFSDSIFEEEVRFYNTEFYDKVNFDRAVFKNLPKFSGAKFNEITCEKTVFKNKIAQEILCRKARLFCEKNDDRDKADYYFKLEKRAKRKQLGPKLDINNPSFNWYKNLNWGDWKGWFELLKRFFEWFFVDLTTAYGTSWNRILIWWVIVILIPAILYSVNDAVLINLKSVSINFFQGLYFSIITFATLGYGDMIPKNGWPQVVASVESILGAILMAAFIAVFSRKFMR